VPTNGGKQYRIQLRSHLRSATVQCFNTHVEGVGFQLIRVAVALRDLLCGATGGIRNTFFGGMKCAVMAVRGYYSTRWIIKEIDYKIYIG